MSFIQRVLYQRLESVLYTEVFFIQSVLFRRFYILLSLVNWLHVYMCTCTVYYTCVAR